MDTYGLRDCLESAALTAFRISYTVSAFGGRDSAIGLATSDTMDCGSFKDLGATGVESHTCDNYNTIDSQIFKDCNPYQMQFGSF